MYQLMINCNYNIKKTKMFKTKKKYFVILYRISLKIKNRKVGWSRVSVNCPTFRPVTTGAMRSVIF